MRRGRISLIIAVTALVLGFAVWAAAANWVLLGTRTVAFVTDQDTIWVGAGMGMFNAVKLHVVDTGVNFDRLTIVFGNGETVDEPIRAFIPAGGYTRDIQLPGESRYIKEIIMYYQTQPGSVDRAQVEAWGIRY